jgi:hypothetical protein
MFKSLLSGGRTGKRHHTAGLRVEPLPDRLVPATFSYNSATDTLTVEGDYWGADSLVVLDHGDGTVTVTDQAGETVNFAEVDRLVVNTHWGNDVVRYKLDGTVVRDMSVEVDLGEGNDRFTGTLNRDISAYDRLHVGVVGHGGDDLITLYGTPTAPARANDHLTDGLAINDGGLRIGTGGELSVLLLGAGGNDRIFLDYQGDLDGILNFQLFGVDGEDTVSAVVRLQHGSAGQVGTSDGAAWVDGWSGTDRLTFHVFDDSGAYRPVFAVIDGGEDWWQETDRGSRTWNVFHNGGVEDLDTI